MKFVKVIKSSNEITVKDLINKLTLLDQNKSIFVSANNGGHTNPKIIELKGDETHDSYYVLISTNDTSFDTNIIKNLNV